MENLRRKQRLEAQKVRASYPAALVLSETSLTIAEFEEARESASQRN